MKKRKSKLKNIKKGIKKILVSTQHLENSIIAMFEAHKKQVRKGDGKPYYIHPIMVALILAKHGYPDEVLAAALTHDILEDTDYDPKKLKKEIGSKAFSIVKTLTQADDKKWKRKKMKLILSIQKGSNYAKAVSVADKIHNLLSLYLSHNEIGNKVWSFFNASKEDKYWFEKKYLKMLKNNFNHQLVKDYENLLNNIKKIFIKKIK